MKILITGDILPQDCNEALFEQGDLDELLGQELERIFNASDFRIGNLEGPLTDSVKEIDKSGPCIKASTASVNGLKRIGFDCVSIANNHIMDFGVEGYKSTVKTLDDSGIIYVGAGENALAARESLVIDINGIKFGVYSCAEYEFTIATDCQPGANAFDALYVLDDIAELRNKVDYLVVLYHGSKEYYRYPVPYVQKRCRRMIEKGANLVLCQHSHCIGCFEKWENGQILYGQGNFLFHRGDDEFRHTGLLVEVEYNDEKWSVDYLPVIKGEKGVRLAEGDEKEQIVKEFLTRSEQIVQNSFVETEYAKFAAKYLTRYYKQSFGRLSIIPRILEKIGVDNIYSRIMRKMEKLHMLNNLRCEAHRDLFVAGLVNALKDE